LLCFTKNLLGEDVLSRRSLEDTHFLERAEAAFDRFPFFVQCGVIFLLWIIEYEAFFCHGTRFSHLNDQRQKEFFIQCFVQPKTWFRIATLRALQAFTLSVYYADPVVAQSVGYPEKAGHFARKPRDLSGTLPAPECDAELETEVLVIGSGAGGAAVASALAERGRRVLILEEGGYFRPHDWHEANSYERYLGLYRDAGFTTAIGIPPVILPLGKTVGGTTTVNSGTCFRLPDAVLNAWHVQKGLLSLTVEGLKPYFEDVEAVLGVAPVTPETQGGNFAMLQRGLKALGKEGGPLLRNAPGCSAAAECCFGCPPGAKRSSGESYIPRAFSLGARLIPYSKVVYLEQSGSQVTRARVQTRDPLTGKVTGKFTVRARQIVVAAGTLHTPALLKHSGIANRSRALGRYMSVHPTGKAVGLFPDKIQGQFGVPQGFQADFLHEQGIMFETVFYPPWLMAANFSAIREEHARIMGLYDNLGVLGFLISDSGNGSVKTLPGGVPMAFYNFGQKEYDAYLEALRWICRVLLEAGATEVFPSVHRLPPIKRMEDIESINRYNISKGDLETVAFHPLGTCRMGIDPRESVVDEHLRVHGYDNLFIADGSVFPSSLGVNPQETIMAFALRLAREGMD
jgi:choline dehydrogenase-like flavoprotein